MIPFPKYFAELVKVLKIWYTSPDFKITADLRGVISHCSQILYSDYLSRDHSSENIYFIIISSLVYTQVHFLIFYYHSSNRI